MTAQIQLHPESPRAEILELIHRLENPRVRAVNERHGNDFGIKMADLRAMAKQLKSNQELGRELWQSHETAAQLLALLLFRPRLFTVEEIDELIRTARVPRVREWATNYIAKKSKHLEELRQLWVRDGDPYVRGAGWELTAVQTVKAPELVDVDAVLSEIRSRMAAEEEPVQWGMNNTLAQIGINYEQHRSRALAIGEELGVFKDYPTSPGCVSPYAPVWITEMVKRQSGS